MLKRRTLVAALSPRLWLQTPSRTFLRHSVVDKKPLNYLGNYGQPNQKGGSQQRMRSLRFGAEMSLRKTDEMSE